MVYKGAHSTIKDDACRWLMIAEPETGGFIGWNRKTAQLTRKTIEAMEMS
jgi:hypothetical protein